MSEIEKLTKDEKDLIYIIGHLQEASKEGLVKFNGIELSDRGMVAFNELSESGYIPDVQSMKDILSVFADDKIIEPISESQSVLN